MHSVSVDLLWKRLSVAISRDQSAYKYPVGVGSVMGADVMSTVALCDSQYSFL